MRLPTVFILFVVSCASQAACSSQPQAAALAPAQDEYRIVTVLREAPDGGAEKRPALVCEGTSNLPECSRIDLRLFFGEPIKGTEMGRDTVEIREGRFSCRFTIYSPPRNLAGLHSARLSFEPHLQKQVVLDKLPGKPRPVCAAARLRVGSQDDADNDRREWGRKLVADIEAITSLAEKEAEARYVRDSDAGKHDQKEWERFIEEAEERSNEILRRVISVPDYKALRLGEGSEVGLDEIREFTLHYIRSCVRVLNNPNHPHGKEVLREAWTHLKRCRQRAVWAVFPPHGDSKLLTGMAQDALNILKGSLEADEAGRAVAKLLFREVIIALDNHAPDMSHEAIIDLAADSRSYFEALGADREKARSLLEGIEKQLRRILEDFKRLK